MEKIYSKDINKVMPILQALAEGKIIQFAATYKEWVDLDGDKDGLLLETLINNPKSYRVKPEPKFRPFKDAEECWQEMLKHQPFGVVKDKYFANYQTHRAFTCLVTNGCHFRGYEDETFENSFKNLLFADGTPFGVKVEK
ncbi:hypothetical protein V7T21_12265 [Segatella copri]|jgi:hypothetical protein|uniref:hypothetical protein n=1 Tax=Segatella copri TaxID=165179 RepID=UPI002FF1D4FC